MLCHLSYLGVHDTMSLNLYTLASDYTACMMCTFGAFQLLPLLRKVVE